MALQLTEFRIITTGTRLLDLLPFDFIKVRFMSYDPVDFYDGYRRLSPIYLQPLITLDNVPTALGQTFRVDKNPTLVDFRGIDVAAVTGVDVSGKMPMHLFFYEWI